MKPLSVSTRTLLCAALAAALASVSCTTRNQEAPPLTGPSEFGTSISITVTPDVLTQDGASQSLVTITARDHNGNPLPNLALRAEIFFNRERVDFGSLSARSLVTDANGRATLVFTAPGSPGGPSVDNNVTVDIVVTPVGSDFNNAAARLVTIRLVPPGVVVPADGLQPRFTFNPTTPEDNQTVFFDASTTVTSPNNPVASFSWNFGDGGRGSGLTTSHAFSEPGTYVVTLTVTDGFNRSASTSQTVTVGAGDVPEGEIVVSPDPIRVGETANFNASSIRPAPGRFIRSYEWDFGDGSPDQTGGPRTTHIYRSTGTYVVTLTVTDDGGRVSVITEEVEVLTDAPTADFTFSPSSPREGQPVSFNAGASSSPTNPPRTLTYFWEFPGGSPSNSTVINPTVVYSFEGTYGVTLTVTDSTGKVGRVQKEITVTDPTPLKGPVVK